MPPRSAWIRVVVCLSLLAAAREVAATLGLLLHSSLDIPGLVGQTLRLLDLRELLRGTAAWLAGGLALWAALTWLRARAERSSARDASERVSHGFTALLLWPAMTAVALVSVGIASTFPYGTTLPVALTQDWSPALDAAVLATLLVSSLPVVRLPAPGPGSVFFIALVMYASVCPQSARIWDGHPGNEPKTLRMAVAIGHGLTLDTEAVSAPMEELTPRPWLDAASDAGATLASESLSMAAAAVHGPHALGVSAITATRVARQTVRGKAGGIYHVLAPGPSLMLAPLLRIDRWLNLLRDTPGRLTVALLAWQSLAALLVAAVFVLARAASGRPGLAAAISLGFALSPPFLFYSFQFYPEMLGALWLTIALHVLLFMRAWSPRLLTGLGLLLATLPWLHQKFLPVWGVLTLMAVLEAVDQMVDLRGLLRLLLPQVISAYLFALYNFAITGSARPDALFLAWGPGGVSSARLGQGLLGLLLDARYGLVPYAPIYLLAAAGLYCRTRLWRAVPVVLVYYATVASADNWSGAVCNLGRYMMPITPFLVALVALALARAKRGGLAIAAMLGAFTALMAQALWNDPHAANDCALLLEKAVFADGSLYIPGLFIRTWADALPGTFVRIAVWLVATAGLAAWWRRQRASPVRVLFVMTGIVLGLALLLERWPSRYRSLRLQDAIETRPGTIAFFAGAEVSGRRALATAREVELLVRSRTPLTTLVLRATGEGTLRVPGQPALPVVPNGVALGLPLQTIVELEGRMGVKETLYRQRIEIESAGEVWLNLE